MIKNKEDLQFYLDADKFSLRKNYRKPKIQDVIWKYQIILRKCEYYRNQPPTILTKLLSSVFQYRKLKQGLQLGFDIGDNVFGAGLRINHFGGLVVNPDARIGMWCDIHQGVNIGAANKLLNEDVSGVPRIGNNVWIGPGAKLYGDITLSDKVIIGANALVNKSISQKGIYAGCPAKQINTLSTDDYDIAASHCRLKYFVRKYPHYSSRVGNV